MFWGDNGAECSCYSILPVLQLYAEADYGADTSNTALSERFKTCTGGIFEDFLQMDSLNTLPGNPVPGNCANPCKYLLFQDLLLGMFDKHMAEEVYNSHFRSSAEKLEECAGRNQQFSGMFATLSRLASVLEMKCDMGIRLTNAYNNNDRALMEQIAEIEIPVLYNRISEFHSQFENQWMYENKAIGFDVQDLRLGGLLMRLKAAQGRIRKYLGGKLESLEELEQERLYFDGRESEGDNPHICANRLQYIVSAGII